MKRSSARPRLLYSKQRDSEEGEGRGEEGRGPRETREGRKYERRGPHAEKPHPDFSLSEFSHVDLSIRHVPERTAEGKTRPRRFPLPTPSIPPLADKGPGPRVKTRELSDRDDRLVFKIDANQEITSSLVWNMVRSKGNKETWKKLVWNANAPARASWFVYLATKFRLLTTDRLKHMGLPLVNRCFLCKSEEESNHHILFSCRVAKNVWSWIVRKFNRKRSPWRNINEELKYWYEVKFPLRWTCKYWRVMFHIVVWQLWWARNQAAHDNWQHPSIRSITNRIWKLGQRVAEAIFSQKEEWQLIQLWWSTVWWDSDAGTYKEASRVAHGGEDIAEMHLLECWLGKMMNSSGRLTIISSNNGWKRRIRAMIEGRRTIPERWMLFRKCYERTSVSNDFPSVDAGQHLLLYGQQDGRNDGG
ncbi:hypothetical protein EJ110_NYTH12623 [Nymphaea thermarum]|nr:hypothetical protein EJ110_NYTH12623 [Nymphaea thermarum]